MHGDDNVRDGQKASFNLVDRSWISVIWREDGRLTTLSLLDLFRYAPQIRDLAGETMMVDASLYRFFLALLHSIYRGPVDMEAWLELWRRGTFDMERIEAYLRRWYDRFDLFHPRYPFYQLPESWFIPPQTKPKKGRRTRKRKDKDLLPVNQLVAHVAAGNNDTLFSRFLAPPSGKEFPAGEKGLLDLSAAEAARHLITFQSFAVGGGRSGYNRPNFRDAPWSGGVIYLARGENLFETLMLNLIPFEFIPDPTDLCAEAADSRDRVEACVQDKPWWEREDITRLELWPVGYLSYLTWPARYVHLYPYRAPDGTWRVRQMRRTQGKMPPGRLIGWDDKKKEEIRAPVRDPMRFYTKRNSKGIWQQQGLSFEKALWRDSAALFTLPKRVQDNAEAGSFALLFWLKALLDELDEQEGAKTYNMMAVISKKTSFSRVDFVHESQLPLAPKLLRDETRLDLLQEALAYAEEAKGGVGLILAQAVKRISKEIATLSGQKPPADERLRKHWGVKFLYWSGLTPYFYVFIDRLIEHEEDEELLRDLAWWQTIVKRQAEKALESVVTALPPTPNALQAYGVGMGYFNRAMGRLVAKQKKRGLAAW